MSSLDRNISEEIVWSGKFIRQKIIKYVRHDKNGAVLEKTWEAAERTTRTGDADAVCMHAIIHRKGQPNLVVLVLQYRPPVGKITVEFPAGLLDPNETVEVAALRELKEETGFVGKTTFISPIIVADAGMTNANMHLVHVDIDGDSPENQNPVQNPDDSFIKVELVEENKLLETLNEYTKGDMMVDAKLYHFAWGLHYLNNKQANL